MKKRLAIVSSLAIIIVIVMTAFATLEIYKPSSTPVASKKPFYVGVTYCGNSITEAEQLIDKVKSYTNLFVLDSVTFMLDVDGTQEIGDYAVNAGLNVILCEIRGGDGTVVGSILNMAQSRWGSNFLGLYYDDEPGGKMLDTTTDLYVNNDTIVKQGTGVEIQVYPSNPSNGYNFYASGEILTSSSSPAENTTVDGVSNVIVSSSTSLIYFPNGTIESTLHSSYTYSNGTYETVNPQALYYLPNGTVLNEAGEAATSQPDGTRSIENREDVGISNSNSMSIDESDEVTIDPGSISQFESYQQVWDSTPLQNSTAVANVFLNTEHQNIGTIGNQSDVPLFTADYGLDWFDYKGGYDAVFGELGWNQPNTQNIALVRGAADMQNKSWGTMIDWQNLSPPTLMSGNQMYNTMKQSYESGAQYVVVFNYSPDNNGVGLLQKEQFAAIQKFWKDVVENPRETNNVTAVDAFVLPTAFGGGLRNQNDNIWGLWPGNSTSQQVWSNLQTAIGKYGSKLDIVYSDPAYPTSGRYQHVYYWNQTS
jgi:hypothetical protein